MAADDETFSRRGFLQGSTAAAMAAGVPGSAAGEEHPPFSPASKPRRISDSLFVLEDTCNVYLLRSGSHALTIDFGSGAILEHVAALGVTAIEWILHTHHHRDQAQ